MLGLFRKTCVALASFLLCASVPPWGFADEKQRPDTVVTVGEMCGGCVKKISKRFESEKDVARVECSIEKKTVTLTPKPGVQLGPKRIWEIMDEISKPPIKLVSPEGTFTSKPK